MMKFLVTGLILYFMYKFMFKPSLDGGQRQENIKQERDIDLRREDKNPREDRGDFIEYEEVE